MSKLDLKYRPKKFSDVLGNDAVKKILISRSIAKTLGDQSMMFGGPKGCGKTSLARITARAMLCDSLSSGEPCNECHTCISILNETCESVEEMDAASQGTVDKIRSMIHDTDYDTLDNTGYKIYIIDEAQRLSKAAQDALLKTVENRDFIVILCTTEPDSIKGPIRDRVEEYPIYPPTEKDLFSRLSFICDQEGFTYDVNALNVIIKMNSKTPRSSILSLNTISLAGDITMSSVEEHFRFNDYVTINDVLKTVDSDPSSALSLLEKLASGESPTWIRNNFVFAITSGLRSTLNMSHNYPVDIDFFPIRGRGWLKVAHDLSIIDKPTVSDIESILLSDILSIASIPHEMPVVNKPIIADTSVPVEIIPPPTKTTVDITNSVINMTLPNSETPKTPKVELKSEKKNKEIEIDGVKFSTKENLTKFDDTFMNPDSNETEKSKEVVSVTLNSDQKPISEKEFFSEFDRYLSRFN